MWEPVGQCLLLLNSVILSQYHLDTLFLQFRTRNLSKQTPFFSIIGNTVILTFLSNHYYYQLAHILSDFELCPIQNRRKWCCGAMQNIKR